MPDSYSDNPDISPAYQSTKVEGYVSGRIGPQGYPTLDVAYRQFTAELNTQDASMDALLARECSENVDQGAVFENVKSFFVETSGNDVYVHELLYPRIVVLSQACDLEWNRNNRGTIEEKDKHDKVMLTVLVAPIFDLAKAQTGEHLQGFDMKMERLNSKTREFIDKHDVARYYQINRDELLDGRRIGFDKGIVDFKHYFSVPLYELIDDKFITSLKAFHREKLSHRFSNFLSRIGIP